MKQPQYRIVFRVQKGEGSRCRMVAAADTAKEIKTDWDWLSSNQILIISKYASNYIQIRR